MQYPFVLYSDERWHNYHMTYIMITKNTSTGVSPLATVELGAIPSMGVNVEVDQRKYTLDYSSNQREISCWL